MSVHFEVNRERVRLLVDALRSGRYEQTQGHLVYDRDGDGNPAFCCLGVACHVAIENDPEIARVVKLVSDDEWDIRFQVLHTDDIYGTDGIRCNTGPFWANAGGTLPERIAEWYGFPGENPTIVVEEHPGEFTDYAAAVANDERGLNFDKIADGFEREYLA